MKPSCSIFLVSESSTSLSGDEGPSEEVSEQHDIKDLMSQRVPPTDAFSFV